MTGHLVRLALLATLIGLEVRGLGRKSWAFVAYVFAVIVCGAAAHSDPTTFNTWEAGTARYDLFAALKVLVALDVARHVLAAFPGARRTARVGALCLLALSTLYLLGRPGTYMTAYPPWAVRLNTVALWLFAYVGLLAVWFNLPVHRWHVHLIVGFIVQLMVFGWLASVLQAAGWTFGGTWSATRQHTDVLVACWWAFGAWIHDHGRA